jgi:hypothetical protein
MNLITRLIFSFLITLFLLYTTLPVPVSAATKDYSIGCTGTPVGNRYECACECPDGTTEITDTCATAGNRSNPSCGGQCICRGETETLGCTGKTVGQNYSCACECPAGKVPTTDTCTASGNKANPSCGGECICDADEESIKKKKETNDNRSSTGSPYTFDLCSQVRSEDHTKCNHCLQTDGIWTGLGCVSFNPTGLVSNLLSIGIGLAGGFALLLLLYGSFLLATSAGNPDQVQKAQDVIGSAVTGLLFIVFSVVILRIIGVDILGIPGL